MVPGWEQDRHPSEYCSFNALLCLLHHDMFQTTFSYLVLVMVDCIPDVAVYQPPDIPPGVQRSFLAGPGEGVPLQSLSLSFEGVIRAEGQVLRYSFLTAGRTLARHSSPIQ